MTTDIFADYRRSHAAYEAAIRDATRRARIEVPQRDDGMPISIHERAMRAGSVYRWYFTFIGLLLGIPAALHFIL